MNVQPDFKLWAKMAVHFEGYRKNAYQDSGGVWTLGLGTTYNHDAKRKVKIGDVADMEAAIRFMTIDKQEVVRQANQYIKVKLSHTKSVAVCDYIYNRGIGNFLKTQLDELINADAPTNAICKEFERTGLWDRLGNKLKGLIRRRKCQSFLWRTGSLQFYF